jgi:hypothetical protein
MNTATEPLLQPSPLATWRLSPGACALCSRREREKQEYQRLRRLERDAAPPSDLLFFLFL